MLRPERMSRVSVTGSKAVMDDVVETMHERRLVHIMDYDGAWDGFEPGNPVEGADRAADRLVTVRSLQSLLGVEEADGSHPRIVTDEAIESELGTIQQEVNELDDRRNDLRTELRGVDEELDRLDPLSDLGIDLDLLSGYDDLAVTVGLGEPAGVKAALADAEDVAAYEVFTGGNTVATFAYPGDAPLQDVLVGVDFTAIEVPDVEATDGGGVSPEAYVADLRSRREQIRSRLDTVESQLTELRFETGDFLLAAEEKLAIEVQRREAPLTFATTENAFVAEGWLPTDRYDEFTAALRSAVGDRIEVEELERADYDDYGVAHDTEELEPDPSGSGTAVPAGEETGEARTDGGTEDRPMRREGPPVVQDNPGAISPFELLVETINRPRYGDLDPTVALFLTFPAFYGFMIGDLGYGLVYTAIGYLLFTRVESDALKALGGITLWAGGFTILFGVLYGEIFGLHLITTHLWEGLLGLHGPPIEKGISPASAHFALLWLTLAFIVGILHVNLGYIFDFVENTVHHGMVDAVLESGSWFLFMSGIWVWVFSTHLSGQKPAFIYHVLSGQPLGFTGFPAAVGMGALIVAAVGFVLMLIGEFQHEGAVGLAVGIFESPNVLVNVLSYARITAVLLAKAGMAFVVNLLFFGVYQEGDPAEFHFMLAHGPQYVLDHHHEATIIFPGLIHAGLAGVVGGLLVLVLGHLVVAGLGVTSAGLQAVRLEYVEFFGKFYEGGGEPYEPFGIERRYTVDA